MTAKNMDKDSPILARIFKEEAEMEVWKKNRDGEYALLKTYPICRWSGDLGPKKKEGDRQAPEGFYTITPGQMNPNSNYYLAFNTGFPNTYDRAWGYTGSDLMVHGDCSSRGCYAMTDEQIQEIYALARESFFGGQKAFQLQAYPFRMTALNMAKHRNNPNFAFWKMLKEGYDHFNASHQEPKVAVCEKRYVFDAAAPDDSTKPLSFNAKGACPVYQLDKTIADAVHDERRQEQLKMAQYIASGVSTVPFRVGRRRHEPGVRVKAACQQRRQQRPPLRAHDRCVRRLSECTGRIAEDAQSRRGDPGQIAIAAAAKRACHRRKRSNAASGAAAKAGRSAGPTGKADLDRRSDRQSVRRVEIGSCARSAATAKGTGRGA